MDNGNYRCWGQRASVSQTMLLVLATTEDPEAVLLKTLLRRIPVRIEIPSLEDRGIKEKTSILLRRWISKRRKCAGISLSAILPSMHY